MNDERLLQEISAACNLASLSERVGEPMDLRLRLYSLAIAYADDREKAKDTEIAELKAQVEGLKTDMQHSRLIEAAQVKESNELKAEIKRLRDFTEKCHKSPEKLVQVVWFADGSFDYCDLVPLQDAAAIALSPAPVTHQPDILTKILALPDDTSAAYIKALIHDHIKTA